MRKKQIIFTLSLLALICLIALQFSLNMSERGSVYTETLPNGLDLIILPTQSPLVSVQLWIRTGARNETPTNSGISHYLEHMLFKNKQEVQSIEAHGGALNGATSYDFTYYYATLPAEHLTSTIRSLGTMVFAASFTPTDAAIEKNIILEEIARGNDDPDQHIYNLIRQKAYGDHPYAQKVAGTAQTIAPLTYTTLRNYYQAWYVPNNATLVIAGDIDRENARKAARVLNTEPSKVTPVALPPDIVSFIPNYATQYIKNLTAPRFTITYSVPGYGSADTYPLDVLTYILSNRTTALLNSRLKEDLDLVYAVNCDYQTAKDRSLFIIDCMVKRPYEISRIRNEIENIMQRMPVTADDLRLAKIRLIADHYLSQESAEQKASAYGYYNTIGGYIYERDYITHIQNVSLKEVQRVANRYFKDSLQFAFIKGK